MLRGVVGDETFFDILRAYYADPNHQYKDAVTEEFRDIASAVSGINLDEFFADWIYGTYFPLYNISYLSELRPDHNYDVFVHLRQYQGTNPRVFDMPVELRMNGVTGSPVYRVQNTEREQDYALVVPGAPSSITVDPNNWILDIPSSESYALNLVTDSLLLGTQHVPYKDSLVAKGGTPPYSFQILSGSLPDGLTFDQSSGVISGVPADGASGSITIGLWDNGMIHYREKQVSMDFLTLGYLPGDLDDDQFVTALDLGMMIDFLFAGGAPPAHLNSADPNGDCQPDPLDLSSLIDYMFAGGPLPQPGCIE
jgi:hypothetical protein